MPRNFRTGQGAARDDEPDAGGGYGAEAYGAAYSRDPAYNHGGSGPRHSDDRGAARDQRRAPHDRNAPAGERQRGRGSFAGDDRSGYAGSQAGYGGGGFATGGYGGKPSHRPDAPRDSLEYARENHRGRGPRGYRRSDERILEEVHERLTEDPHLDARDIEVQVEDGEVTLTGMVRSRFEKRHAEDLCEAVLGVENVMNSLRVRQQTAFGSQDMTGGGTGANR